MHAIVNVHASFIIPTIHGEAEEEEDARARARVFLKSKRDLESVRSLADRVSSSAVFFSFGSEASAFPVSSLRRDAKGSLSSGARQRRREAAVAARWQRSFLSRIVLVISHRARVSSRLLLRSIPLRV